MDVIKTTNLTVTAPDGMTVLDNVSLTVKQGEFTAVIGPNGAGKTTLLRAVLGLITPTSGSVEVFGGSPESALSKIGYVPQTMTIDRTFPISVYETVLMGTFARLGVGRRPGKREREDALKALETAGIADLKDRPIGNLSGGQRQRVFIARALVNKPELLILDEPMTGVDAATTENLYTLLKSLRSEGVTIIMVSHDVGVVASFVDKIACLNKTLISHCLPHEIGRDHLEQMYGCDASYLHHCGCLVVEEHHHD
ncbi:MAG: metal ABC transporter ATP-binding protein [Abditibacteriota bacterium]|nr:metal ABC transporter ATP-binding protein [Abditibacteriota bacterium]